MCFCPLGSTNRKTLECLQWQAAKIVYGFKPDIAIETILENLRWPPLTKTMEKHCALLVNKCLVGEVCLYFKDYFMLRCQSDNQHVLNRCTRSSITDIILPKFHLDVAKKSFYYHGACTFNSLPMTIKILPPKEFQEFGTDGSCQVRVMQCTLPRVFFVLHISAHCPQETQRRCHTWSSESLVWGHWADDEDTDRKCFDEATNVCACQWCRPHGAEDVKCVNLWSSGECVYSKQSFSFLCPFNTVWYQ